jgi:uncharacterized protein YbdZ (MbtH family)
MREKYEPRPLRFYSQELSSKEARLDWVEPDWTVLPVI